MKLRGKRAMLIRPFSRILGTPQYLNSIRGFQMEGERVAGASSKQTPYGGADRTS
jgi:hypothetical protein